MGLFYKSGAQLAKETAIEIAVATIVGGVLKAMFGGHGALFRDQAPSRRRRDERDDDYERDDDERPRRRITV